MQEQQSAGRARLIGYALGVAAVAVVIIWRLVH
jgi:hypothetical protein